MGSGASKTKEDSKAASPESGNAQEPQEQSKAETLSPDAAEDKKQLSDQTIDDDFLDPEARNLLSEQGQAGKDTDETHHVKVDPPPLKAKSKASEIPLVTVQLDEKVAIAQTEMQDEGKAQENGENMEELQEFAGDETEPLNTITAALFSQLNAGPPAGSSYDLKALAEGEQRSIII